MPLSSPWLDIIEKYVSPIVIVIHTLLIIPCMCASIIIARLHTIIINVSVVIRILMGFKITNAIAAIIIFMLTIMLIIPILMRIVIRMVDGPFKHMFVL